MLTAVPIHADGQASPAVTEAPTAQQGTESVAGQAQPTTPAPQAPTDPAAPPASSGEVVVTGRTRAGDPLQDFNVASFDAAQSVDRALVGPASKVYRKKIPRPIRTGFRNFLNNLREPIVFINFILQLKVGKACETVGRFALNTTVGLVGTIDIAKKKPFYLPRRRNGFANTLGFYGVKPGPFFFAPLLGPTTVRDLIGNIVDQLVPIGPIRPFRGRGSTIPVAVFSALDFRAEFDDELERQRATADPYAAAKRYYLERRQAEIDVLRGRPPAVSPEPIPPVSSIGPLPEEGLVAPTLPEIVGGRSVMGPPA